MFISWLMKHDTLQQLFALARTVSGFALEDEALQASRKEHKAPVSKLQQTGTQLHLQHLRWMMAKRNPQAFSDKAEVNITVPISITSTLDLGADPAGVGTGSDIPDIYAFPGSGMEPRTLELEASYTEVVSGSEIPTEELDRVTELARESARALGRDEAWLETHGLGAPAAETEDAEVERAPRNSSRSNPKRTKPRNPSRKVAKVRSAKSGAEGSISKEMET